MTYTSDKSAGPTAGPHVFEATAFIAHLVDHIPDKGQVLCAGSCTAPEGTLSRTWRDLGAYPLSVIGRRPID